MDGVEPLEPFEHLKPLEPFEHLEPLEPFEHLEPFEPLEPYEPFETPILAIRQKPQKPLALDARCLFRAIDAVPV